MLLRVLAPLAIVAAACSDSTEPGEDRLAGVYNAVTVDGQPLPHEFGSGTVLLSYRIELRDDGTYDLEFNRRLPDDTEVETSDTGDYTYDSDSGAISFQGAIPGVLHATITDDGDTMTLSAADVGGSVVVLTR
jgi:hypothetical protein